MEKLWKNRAFYLFLYRVTVDTINDLENIKNYENEF